MSRRNVKDALAYLFQHLKISNQSCHGFSVYRCRYYLTCWGAVWNVKLPHTPTVHVVDSVQKVVSSKKEDRRSKINVGNTTNTTDVQSKEPLVMDSVLKSVHSDLIDKQKRSKNVVVSGLKSSLSITDSDLFQRLCFDHLGIAVSTFTTRRLGTAKVAARYKVCSWCFQTNHLPRRWWNMLSNSENPWTVEMSNKVYNWYQSRPHESGSSSWIRKKSGPPEAAGYKVFSIQGDI